jgi:hypothetical protein
MPGRDDLERDDAIEAFLAGSKYYALSAAANLLEQFVIAEVHQHRNQTAGVIRLHRGYGGRVDPGYSFFVE